MAENKQEGGSAPFITQTEEFNIENDMDRHSRNMQLQSKGFREELHSPQASPYVHATERSSQIGGDAEALRGLAHGIDASIRLYEKYDEGPSIQQYIDDVTELSEAHRTGRINDEVYRREMRKARNAAQNAYADNPRAMAKLKDFENGGMFAEYKEYEASMWKVSQKYTELTGNPATPWDENFQSVQVATVQEYANSALELNLARNKQGTLAAKDQIDYEELKPAIADLSAKLSDFMTNRYIKKLENGYNITEKDIKELEDYSIGLMAEFQKLYTKHLDKPLVRAQYDMFRTAFQRIQGLRNITNHNEMMREFQEIQAGLTIKATQQQLEARGDKLSKEKGNALQNIIDFNLKEDKYPYTLLAPAAKALNGDKTALKGMIKQSKNGDVFASSIAVMSSYLNGDPDETEKLIFETPKLAFEKSKEGLDYDNQQLIKDKSVAVWNKAVDDMREAGKRKYNFLGKETPLSKLIKYSGFNGMGLNLTVKKGAPQEAYNFANYVKDRVTKQLYVRNYCTSEPCDFKKLAKNPKVNTSMKELLKGIADG